MKPAIFVGTIVGIVAGIIFGFAEMVKASGNQWEQNEKAFRAACAEVKGIAVWNNKYWECLK